MLTNEQKEDLRGAVLAALVVRHPAAITARQIAHAVMRDVDFVFEEADVVAALELLRGLPAPLVEWLPSDFGGTKYWRATSAGVLHEERS
jgi:hypothetical protein